MVVVMGIIAIILALGVSALLASRKQAQVDSTAEALLSYIREAQNRAVSITNEGGGPTKVWGIELQNDNTVDLVYLNGVSELVQTAKETHTPMNGVTITSSGGSISGVYFSAPFAASYLFTGTVYPCSSSNWTTNSSRPAQDWYPTGCDFASATINSDRTIRFEVTDGNNIRSVVVKANGDAYIE